MSYISFLNLYHMGLQINDSTVGIHGMPKSRSSRQVSWEQPVSPRPRGNVPYFSRFVRRAAPGGKFYCIPFLCAVLWESWRSLAPLSTALPHLWWENYYRKKYGAGCKRKYVQGNNVLALSALAVIGYIFIIIYSNRKRYLGMGMG